MEFRDDARTAALRAEVRNWIAHDLTEAERASFFGPGTDGDAQWNRIVSVRRKLAARGWTAPAWPVEYGGMGLGYREQAAFNEELAYARVPGPDFIAINYVGPTLMLYGTDEQKARFLPSIVRGEMTWCQGYSEPGAGSDLASLQTRAELSGDAFVLNGQKVWTSNAHRADWMFLLARTDPDAPKHRGISYLLLDMRTPGLEMRPLVNMAGTHEFNEVFFDNVRIPRRNLVGELNRGWYVGMATLDFERSAIGSVASVRRELDDLIDTLTERRASPSRSSRLELADRRLEMEIARLLSLRIISMQESGLVPNHEASIAKLFTTELNQRTARTVLKILGMHGVLVPGEPRAPVSGRWAYQYLRTVANTIEGGTSEIQRNIVATRGLGLPRG